MSFSCYAHGWTHLEKPCPLCVPARTITTNSVTLAQQPTEAREREWIWILVDKFLGWPLPLGINPDPYPPGHTHAKFNSGTNLLSSNEARELFEYLFPYDVETNSTVGWMVKYERARKERDELKAEVERLIDENLQLKLLKNAELTEGIKDLSLLHMNKIIERQASSYDELKAKLQIAREALERVGSGQIVGRKMYMQIAQEALKRLDGGE